MRNHVTKQNKPCGGTQQIQEEIQISADTSTAERRGVRIPVGKDQKTHEALLFYS